MACEVSSKSSKVSKMGNIKDLGADGRIILKLIIRK
jgi:hypothetical protein